MRAFWNRAANSIVHRVAKALQSELKAQSRALDVNRMLAGQLHADRVRRLPDGTAPRDTEFSVYSQWGEDGIIEYLVSRIDIPNEVFVEFGVQDYTESNTRFLLKNRNWRGLVLDSSPDHVAWIRNDAMYWRYDLAAIQGFVTAENINELIRGNDVSGDIGLLSIDIDGNDYWVWKAIDVVSPRIVVCEYNSVFGSERAVTVPYDPDFMRSRAHYSNLFFGASLRALCLLAREKGYGFVGCGSAGANAFFVRRDCMARVRELTPEEGYTPSSTRESRDTSGELNYLHGRDRLAEIAMCEVLDVISGERIKVGELIT